MRYTWYNGFKVSLIFLAVFEDRVFIVQQPAAKGTHDVSFKELIATAACRSCVHGYGDPIYIPFQRAKFQYLAFLLW